MCFCKMSTTRMIIVALIIKSLAIGGVIKGWNAENHALSGTDFYCSPVSTLHGFCYQLYHMYFCLFSTFSSSLLFILNL